jgi:hypothetical protein
MLLGPITALPHDNLDKRPDQEVLDFCMQFAVSASLRLADAEAQVVDPPWANRDNWGRVDLVTIREEPSVQIRNQQKASAGRLPTTAPSLS